MLVRDFFDLDVDLLEDKSGTSDYWDRCSAFYTDVAGKEMADLSSSQIAWLHKIAEGLGE
jgi:hypothetical protein